MQAIASAALVALLVAGCSAPLDDAALPIDDLDLEPRRTTAAVGHVATGPVVELVRGSIEGSDFAIVAWSEADGTCLFAMSGGDSSLACGPMPGPAAGPIGVMTTDALGSGGPLEVVGAVSPQVAEVVAELPDGRRAHGHLVSLAPAGLDGALFFLVLPPDIGDHDVVALDADGTELVRLELVEG